MALVRDGSGPAAVKSDPTSVASLTTAAFTPPASSLLVLAGILDTSNAAATITPSTVTGSTSVWTTVEQFGVTGHGIAGIYTATVTSSVSTTNRATFSVSSDAAMHTDVYTGANASPIGAHGHGTVTNPYTISYTASAVGSICVIAVEDYEGGNVTISGTTLDVALTSNSNGKIVHQTAPATGLTTQTFTLSGSAGQVVVWAEILPTGSGPASGATADVGVTVAASGVTSAGLSTGAGAVVGVAVQADGVLGYPNLAGKPAVVVQIANPPPTGGAAATLVTDLYRNGVRIAANLPANATFVDLLPGAGPVVYTATAYAASGASATST